MPDDNIVPPLPVLAEYRGIKAVKAGTGTYFYKISSSNTLLIIQVRWRGSDHLGWELSCELAGLILVECFTGWADVGETVATYDRLWARLLEYVKEQRDHQAKVLRGWESSVSQMEALTVTIPAFWERLDAG